MISSCALLLVAASQHLGNKGSYEEWHPSVGAVCEHDIFGVFSGGYFRNSEKDDTLWFAKRKYIEAQRNNYGEPFYEYGLVVGYKDFPVLPLARVGFDFEPVKRVGAELFLLPGIEKVRGKPNVFLVLGAQLKIK